MSTALRIALGLIVLVVAVFIFGLVPTRVAGTAAGLAEQSERAAKAGVGSTPAAQQGAEFREFQQETAKIEARAESLAIAKRKGQ